MLNEVFIKLPNYRNYSVSNTGKVTNGKIILKTYINNSGYHCIDLQQDGKREKWLLHRLVATYFKENNSNLPTVNHIDGNKNNNCISNLEWCSYSDNLQHARDMGLNPHKPTCLGVKKGKTSKYRNVSFDKNRKKWFGSVRFNKTNYGTKRFDSEIDAAKYVNEIIIKNNLPTPLNTF